VGKTKRPGIGGAIGLISRIRGEAIMAKKKAGETEDGDGRKAEKPKRTATTMYVRSDLFKEFKKRVLDEPLHGYEIVEQFIDGYVHVKPEIAAGLKKACELEDRKPYEIVEDALAAYLKKTKILR
jgi:hypothetical protein